MIATIAAPTLAELFVYNDWARDKVLEWAAPLSDEQLDKPFQMGIGSLRNTLHHIWAAERLWLDRWLEKSNPKFTQPEAGLPLSEIKTRYRQTADERNALFARCSEADFRRRITFTNMKGETYSLPLGDMMLHVCNHGIYHRAQALNMLRHNGVMPNGLDYLFMRVERPTVPFPPPILEQLRQLGRTVRETAAPVALDLDTFREYFRYGDWASNRVWNVAAQLSEEQIDRPFEMGLGTLRKTLLHIRDAEHWWLQNWLHGPEGGFPKLPPTTSLLELQTLFAETVAGRDAYLGKQTDADLQTVVHAEARPGLRLSFRLGESLLQLCGHGTHHRAQAVNMLRQLGAETPGLDYILWVREQQT